MLDFSVIRAGRDRLLGATTQRFQILKEAARSDMPENLQGILTGAAEAHYAGHAEVAAGDKAAWLDERAKTQTLANARDQRAALLDIRELLGIVARLKDTAPGEAVAGLRGGMGNAFQRIMPKPARLPSELTGFRNSVDGFLHTVDFTLKAAGVDGPAQPEAKLSDDAKFVRASTGRIHKSTLVYIRRQLEIETQNRLALACNRFAAASVAEFDIQAGHAQLKAPLAGERVADHIHLQRSRLEGSLSRSSRFTDASGKALAVLDRSTLAERGRVGVMMTPIAAELHVGNP